MDFVRPTRPVALSLVSGRGHYDSVIQAVMAAEHSVWIATANLKDLHVVRGKRARPLLAHFSSLAEKGVGIRILYASEPSSPFKRSFDKYPNLVRGAVEMQPCLRIHCKIVIVDGALAYVGSANLTGAGLGAKSDRRRNFEAGVLTRETGEIRRIMDYFDALWMGAGCDDCGLKGECEEPIRGV